MVSEVRPICRTAKGYRRQVVTPVASSLLRLGKPMYDITVLNAVSPLIPDASPVTAAAALPPKPKLTLGYLPARSESISFDGTLLDYLPVQLICIGYKCTGRLASGPPSTDYPFIGNIDPAGVQHETMDYTAYFNQ